MAAAAFHTLKVARVERLTDDSAAVTFDVPAHLAGEYAFAAGQALTLRRFIDGEEHRRSYSICAPAGSRPRIGVREIPGGLFSSWLVRQVRPGAEIDVLPPTGSLRADPAVPARHLMIAAGSGITPMISIAATVLRNSGTHVRLLYGNRTSKTVMFAEELGDLKNRYLSRLQIVHVLSREPRDVELFSGRLDAARLRRLLTTLTPVDDVDHVWLCGPLRMVTDARDVLADLGVPREKVHVELFHVDEPPPEPRRDAPAVTGETSDVTIILDGRKSTATVPRHRPILDSAQATRADLPYACKGGVCGTCRARVTDGKVEMARNYALEPSEVAAGFVLTCQSRPVTASVTLDYDA
ncbi:1,2-phenylacetyl-CoA epoxidase subunit PaaE [Thermopolyspora sp. NPDC052614]|uniref:1,2-phenylacetyl-CoA epoxidase subunit PaaE n=1 Tax=Thermopolyspora sp. NPDC052614 TaxID=3155682 RepID=UPI00343A19D8